jgi:hypothetical protein
MLPAGRARRGRGAAAVRSLEPSLPVAALAFLAACSGAPAAGPSGAVFGPEWDDGKAEVAAHRSRVSVYGTPREAEEFLITVTEEQDRRELVKALPGAPAAARRRVVKLNRERTIPTGIYTYRQFSSTFVDRETLELTKIAMSSQEWCGTTFVEATVRDGRLRLRTFSYFEGQGDRDFEIAWPTGAWAVDALPLLARGLPADAGGRLEVKLLPSLLSNKVAEPALAKAVVTWTAPARGRQEVVVSAPGHGEQRLALEAGGERRVLEWSHPDGGRTTLLRSERLPYWSLNASGDERRRERLRQPPGPGPG